MTGAKTPLFYNQVRICDSQKRKDETDIIDCCDGYAGGDDVGG